MQHEIQASHVNISDERPPEDAEQLRRSQELARLSTSTGQNVGETSIWDHGELISTTNQQPQSNPMLSSTASPIPDVPTSIENMTRESPVSAQTPSLSPVGESSNKDQQAPNVEVVAEPKEQRVVSDNATEPETKLI